MHYVHYYYLYGGGMVAQPKNGKDMAILSVMPQSSMPQIVAVQHLCYPCQHALFLKQVWIIKLQLTQEINLHYKCE